MYGAQQSLTGKRVYGSGSFAPTRGQVSAQGAQGYLRRNLAQRAKKAIMPRPGFNGIEGNRVGAMRIGADGKSDTRSGVASAALARLKQTPGTKPGLPGGHGQTPGINPTGPGGGPMHDGGPVTTTPGSGGNGGNTPPTVTINQSGQMELPYDSQYSAELYSSLNDFNNQLMQLQIAQQQQQAQYAQQMRDEGIAYGQQQISDLATNAGAGTAFSSRYATDVGHTSGQHQNNVSDLTGGNAQYAQQVAAQKAAIQDAFNQQLQQAAAERASNAAADAGNLGYGKAKVTKPVKKPGGGGKNHHPKGHAVIVGHKPKQHVKKHQTPGTKPPIKRRPLPTPKRKK